MELNLDAEIPAYRRKDGIGGEHQLADLTSTQALSAKTVTGPRAYSSLTAAKTITAAESGTTFFLNLAGGFTVTLPTPAIGLHYRFIVGIAPTTAYVISSATNDNIAGSVLSSSGAAEDTEAAATADVINFVANTAKIGDRIEIESDDTNWYAYAICSAAGGVTFTG